MDIDRYIARHQPTWDRLDDLTRRARRKVGDLSTDELDELVACYERTSSHLSYARTYLRNPALVGRLTALVGSANGVIYGKRPRTWRTVLDFFAYTFPGAVYHIRRFVLVAAVLFFVPALLLGVWLANDRDALEASAPQKVRQTYVDDLFEQYYSDQPAPVFFTMVTTNNIRVSFIAYALGAVSFGVGAAYLLLRNGAPVGIIGAWMAESGDLGRFFGFILPHGALELSAIVIAGAAGMAVGWSVIAPGDRTRGTALRDEAQRSIAVVMGLMAMFVAAGLVEGFITGSGLPVGVRVGIGGLLWFVVVGYLVLQGRAAAARGITGLLVEPPRSWDDEPDRRRPALEVPVEGRLA